MSPQIFARTFLNYQTFPFSISSIRHLLNLNRLYSFHACNSINQSSLLLGARWGVAKPSTYMSPCANENMSAKTLLLGSPEILIQIFASCDTFAQVIALSSTCRDVHAVWKLNASPILDRVAR
jgi:hypothetical protein